MAGSADSRNAACRAVSLVLLVVNVLLTCGVGVALVTASRNFRSLFADLAVALAAATAWLLAVPPAAYLAGIFLLGVGLVVKEAAIRRPVVRLWINIAALLLLLALTGVWTAAVLVPLLNAMAAVQ